LGNNGGGRHPRITRRRIIGGEEGDWSNTDFKLEGKGTRKASKRKINWCGKEKVWTLGKLGLAVVRNAGNTGPRDGCRSYPKQERRIRVKERNRKSATTPEDGSENQKHKRRK